MKKIHFVGIGGIGLSAIAKFLKEDGYIISGSDMQKTQITNELEKNGIIINIPHNKNAIKDQDTIIYSAAVKEDNEELLQAKKCGLNVLSRKEALSIILQNKKVFSVAGAHGKSTTSAMLSSILNGSMIIGAVSKQFNSNSVYKKVDILAFEADESDASFINSNPHTAIVTNAEPEHMEFYNYDLDAFFKTYKCFLNQAKRKIINAECEFLSQFSDIDAIRLYPSKDIKNIHFVMKDNEPYTKFELLDFGEFEVHGIGEHNALSASLAILASLDELDIKSIKENLKRYRGIKKRFDIIHKSEDFIIIDDYAHHPTEIKATLKSAIKYAKMQNLSKVTAIWQPHKYSRTLDNLDGFKECFEGVDELILLPVYAAGQDFVDIDFKSHFARFKPYFADRIVKNKDSISFHDKTGRFFNINSGLVIGFNAGDLTYQLRGEK